MSGNTGSGQQGATADGPAGQAVEQGAQDASGFKSEESKQAVLDDLARERQQRQALQARLDEIEKASLSELERAQRDAQEQQAAAERATAEALRWRIAAKHGVTDEDAELFLTGADEDTLTKQAQRLAARQAEQGTSPGPRPDLTQGTGATATGGPAQEFARFLSNQMS